MNQRRVLLEKLTKTESLNDEDCKLLIEVAKSYQQTSIELNRKLESLYNDYEQKVDGYKAQINELRNSEPNIEISVLRAENDKLKQLITQEANNSSAIDVDFKQKDDIPNLFVGTLNALWTNNPDVWCLKNITIDNLDDKLSNKNKVCVMGPFKTGKSMVIEILGNLDYRLSSEIISTKGIHFHIVESSQTVFMDTEGFHQPLNTSEPFIKRDFITEFVKRVANTIIIVMDRLTTHDIDSFNKLKSFYQNNNSFGRMIVIHNIKTIHNEENLKTYQDNLNDHFNCKKKGDWFSTQEASTVALKRKVVEHYFVGNKFSLKDIFNKVMNEIKTKLSSGIININVKKELCSAIGFTVFKHYNTKPTLVDEKESHRHFKFDIDGGSEIIRISQGIVLNKRTIDIQLDSNIKMNYLIDGNDYKDQDENQFIKVIIEAPGVDPKEAIIRVVNSNTIEFSGRKYINDLDGIDVVERLDLPHDLNRVQAGKQFIEKQRKDGFSNKFGVFMIKVLSNEDFDEYFGNDQTPDPSSPDVLKMERQLTK